VIVRLGRHRDAAAAAADAAGMLVAQACT